MNLLHGRGAGRGDSAGKKSGGMGNIPRPSGDAAPKAEHVACWIDLNKDPYIA